MMHDFQFGGEDFQFVGDAALYWPTGRTLLVADLHLEKASSYARNGQMLPPYDSHATLAELARIAEKANAKSIICLGDNFHDNGGEARLPSDAAAALRAMTTRYHWVWITGNHDPGLDAKFGGEALAEMKLEDIMLRHEAMPDWQGAEISGHFHPKLRLKINGRHVVRRCLIASANKLILPAFGALTGGMDAAEAALIAQPGLADENGSAVALVALASKLVRFPLLPKPADRRRTLPAA